MWFDLIRMQFVRTVLERLHLLLHVHLHMMWQVRDCTYILQRHKVPDFLGHCPVQLPPT